MPLSTLQQAIDAVTHGIWERGIPPQQVVERLRSHRCTRQSRCLPDGIEGVCSWSRDSLTLLTQAIGISTSDASNSYARRSRNWLLHVILARWFLEHQDARGAFASCDVPEIDVSLINELIRNDGHNAIDKLPSSLRLHELQRNFRFHGLHHHENATTRSLQDILREHLRICECSISQVFSSTCPTLSVPQPISESDRSFIADAFHGHLKLYESGLYACSTCGVTGLLDRFRKVLLRNLDYKVLTQSLEELRNELLQKHDHLQLPDIEVCRFWEQDSTNSDLLQLDALETEEQGRFALLCRNCEACTRGSRKVTFQRVPALSYANGIDPMPLPLELQNLSYAEKKAISLATATKCFTRISGTLPGQYQKLGHCAFFQQEPRFIPMQLPRPIGELADEIAVIYSGREGVDAATVIRSYKSLSIIRRSRICAALEWLMQNNVLYRHITIDRNSLNEYPVDGHVPLPDVLNEAAQESENDVDGSTYTEKTSLEAAINACADQRDEMPLILSTLVDPDGRSQNSSASRAKRIADALLQQREDEIRDTVFIRWRTGNDPLNASWDDPILWGKLWPTLWPYGINCIGSKRRIKVKTEDLLKHYLEFVDTRFATEAEFLFVVFDVIQRKQSSSSAWLTAPARALKKITNLPPEISVPVLKDLAEKLKKDRLYRPTNETEKKVMSLLNTMQIRSQTLFGSPASMLSKRAEMKALQLHFGLPTFWLTINPADSVHPLFQIFSGNRVLWQFDADALRDKDPQREAGNRARRIAADPVAGARAFNALIEAFWDTIAGDKLPNRRGAFGEKLAHYGVVEAQGRGSLHMHGMIWTKDMPDPLMVIDAVNRNDEGFKEAYINFIDSIVSQDTPADQNVENRPWLPTMFAKCAENVPSSFEVNELLEAVGQHHHTHTAACFKHLKEMPRPEERDANCRFGFPKKHLFDRTHFDSNGHLQLRTNSRTLNPYNDLMLSTLRCNHDIKPILSGDSFMSRSQYVTNYAAKAGVDSADMVKALLLAYEKAQKQGDTPALSNLLTRALNQMTGLQRLSSQQVAMFLLGYGNHYTSHQFKHVFWRGCLTFLDPTLFQSGGTSDGSQRRDDVENDEETEERTAVYQSGSWKVKGSLLDDYRYRSDQLSDCNLWEFCQQYDKVVGKSGLDFLEDHLQCNSHSLAPTELQERIVVWNGVPLDLGISSEGVLDDRGALIRLALFVPWREISDLREEEEAWTKSYDRRKSAIVEMYGVFLHNIDLISCARHEGVESAKDRNLRKAQGRNLHDDNHSNDEEDESVAAAADTTDTDEDTNAARKAREWERLFQEVDESDQDFSPALALDAQKFANLIHDIDVNGGSHSRLNTTHLPFIDWSLTVPTSAGFNEDGEWNEGQNDGLFSNIASSASLPRPLVSNANDTIDAVRRALENQNASLPPWMQQARDIISRRTLNREQRRVFLHIVAHDMEVNPPQLLLHVTGPGGTGKSALFEALKDFLRERRRLDSIIFTAPTGTAASNIGGCTIHSAAALGGRNFSENSRTATKLRQIWSNKKYLVIDEISFCSAQTFDCIDQNLRKALGASGTPFGGLNVIVCGDFCQLPPVFGTPLYAPTAHPGKFLFDQFNKVVELKQVMRQRDDPQFRDLCQRARKGQLNHIQDLPLLQSRLLKPEHHSMLLNTWLQSWDNTGMQLLTFSNGRRDVWNDKLCREFARSQGQTITFATSVDRFNHVETFGKKVANLAWSVPPKQKAGNLLGNLPLVHGLPCYLTKNLNPSLGLANGTFVRIMAWTGHERQHGTSRKFVADAALVHVPEYTGPTLIAGFPKCVVIHAVDETLTLDKSKFIPSGRTGTRRQLPLVPAFGSTVHSAQGRTLGSVLIDFNSIFRFGVDNMTALVYVALSRLRSAEGLFILEDVSNARQLGNHIQPALRRFLQHLTEKDEAIQQTEMNAPWASMVDDIEDLHG